MSGTFTCLHCQSRIQVNPRLKNSRQQYCRKKECQKARKRKWQQDRMNNDDDYRTKQLESVKRWQKAKPFHSYMAMYRQDHLEYVEINRKQQAETGKYTTRGYIHLSILLPCDSTQEFCVGLTKYWICC